MAYFYGHIKALKSDNTVFKVDFESADTSSTPAGMNTPKILNGSTDCGNIITSDIVNGCLNNNFSFRGTLSYLYNADTIFSITRDTAQYPNTLLTLSPNKAYNAGSNSFGKIQFCTGGRGGYISYQYKFGSDVVQRLMIQATDSACNHGIQIRAGGLRSKDSSLAGDYTCTIEQTIKGRIEITTTLPTAYSSTMNTNPIFIGLKNGSSVNGLAFAGSTFADTQAYFNVPVNATYFNATSDKRAKENIRKATFSALDVIQSLPIYNFDYSEDKTHSIGLIAQDAQDINLDDFEIVANKEASGENGNYMSVKESKLVYIAWKAIQEQQEVIKALKQEIEELKKNKKD